MICVSTIYDLPITAEYEYCPGEPMVRYYANGDGDPGCPESVELLAVWLENNGKKLDLIDYLPADIIKAIEGECMEDAHSKLEPDPDL